MKSYNSTKILQCLLCAISTCTLILHNICSFSMYGHFYRRLHLPSQGCCTLNVIPPSLPVPSFLDGREQSQVKGRKVVLNCGQPSIARSTPRALPLPRWGKGTGTRQPQIHRRVKPRGVTEEGQSSGLQCFAGQGLLGSAPHLSIRHEVLPPNVKDLPETLTVKGVQMTVICC